MTYMSLAKAAIIIATCGVILVVILYVESIRTERARDFFSAALAGANVKESVSIRGISFDILAGNVYQSLEAINGRDELEALRLAYALTLAQNSPILGLEGTDPEALTLATEEMEKAASELSARQETSFEKYVVGKGLFPTLFLKTAAHLEMARKSFLAEKDTSTENTYRTTLQNTLSAYRDDLARYRAAFEIVVPMDSPPYMLPGGEVSRKLKLEMLSHLEHSSEETARLIRERTYCLNYDIKYCNPRDLYTSIPQEDLQAPVSSASLTLARNIRSIFAAAEEEKGTPPLILLENQTCIDSSFNIPPFITFIRKHPSVAETRWPVSVGDLFLVPTKNNPYSFYRYLAEKKISYAPYFPMTTYTCLDPGSSVAAAATTLATRNYAISSPASTWASAKLLHGIEQRLNSDVVTESDARDYVRLALKESEKGVTVPQEARNALQALALQFKDMGSSLELITYRTALNERELLYLKDRGAPADISAKVLFYVRSPFWNLFLGHQASFSDKALPLGTEMVRPADFPFVRYSILSKQVSADTLIHDMKTFDAVHGE